MNDYDLPRFSKVDIRDFWSLLASRKTDLMKQLNSFEDENHIQFVEGQIDSLKKIMGELERTFDLF